MNARRAVLVDRDHYHVADVDLPWDAQWPEGSIMHTTLWPAAILHAGRVFMYYAVTRVVGDIPDRETYREVSLYTTPVVV